MKNTKIWKYIVFRIHQLLKLYSKEYYEYKQARAIKDLEELISWELGSIQSIGPEEVDNFDKLKDRHEDLWELRTALNNYQEENRERPIDKPKRPIIWIKTPMASSIAEDKGEYDKFLESLAAKKKELGYDDLLFLVTPCDVETDEVLVLNLTDGKNITKEQLTELVNKATTQ